MAIENTRHMTENWKKVAAEKVTDIIDMSALDEGSQSLLKDGMRPEAFIEALSGAGQWADAANVLVAALPAREAIWWVCLCAKGMDVMKRNEAEAKALQAAEKWAFKPNDENRQEAFKQAQLSDNPSAGTLACMAVVFSGGNLDMGGGQIIEFDAGKFAGIASAVVLMAAAEQKGAEFAGAMQRFLLMGQDIACGGSGKI
jgi:ABC-type Fe3+-siderophore transport system permease subunit